MHDVDASVGLLEDDGEYLKLSIDIAKRLSDVSSREDNVVEDGSEDDFEDDSEDGSKVALTIASKMASKSTRKGTSAT